MGSGRVSFEALPRRVRGIVGSTVEFVPEVSSTNDNLLRRDDCPDGYVLVTDLQTAGRGRAGHRWSAPAGENLLFSFSLTLASPTQLFSLLPVFTALAVCEGSDAIGIEGVQAKWPNDIVYEERKLGGILIESRVRGKRARAVCGIGVNVNQTVFPDEIAEAATSLSLLAGAPVDRSRLLAAIIDALNRHLSYADPSQRIASYTARCRTVGRAITFQAGGERRRGRAVGVDEHGRLLVEMDGRVLAFSGNEVSHVQS